MGIYKDKYPDGISPTFWDNFVVPMVKDIRGNKCEICDSTKKLHVHHIDYNNVNIDSLLVVCVSCHKKIHNKIKNTKQK
jgi:hypothetical protein